MTEKDNDGVWELFNGCRILIEPSASWISQKEIEYSTQAMLNSLVPSQEEINQAEFEIKAINLLTELGVI